MFSQQSIHHMLKSYDQQSNGLIGKLDCPWWIEKVDAIQFELETSRHLYKSGAEFYARNGFGIAMSACSTMITGMMGTPIGELRFTLIHDDEDRTIDSARLPSPGTIDYLLNSLDAMHEHMLPWMNTKGGLTWILEKDKLVTTLILEDGDEFFKYNQEHHKGVLNIRKGTFVTDGHAFDHKGCAYHFQGELSYLLRKGAFDKNDVIDQIEIVHPDHPTFEHLQVVQRSYRGRRPDSVIGIERLRHGLVRFNYDVSLGSIISAVCILDKTMPKTTIDRMNNKGYYADDRKITWRSSSGDTPEQFYQFCRQLNQGAREDNIVVLRPDHKMMYR
ncbi:hypothetical protein H6504_00300 [Candidatus Woesearchaeota archaeon]|nr:hypothetical protein [Candidatus Woesearchaeota archaeon]